MSPLSQDSRAVTYAIKGDGFYGTVRVIPHTAKRIAQKLADYPFLADCFGPDVTLIPMPRSGPRKPGSLWPVERICSSLVAEGLAGEVLSCLERTTPVQRASRAAPGQRPDPQDHYDSLNVVSQQPLQAPDRITLVDDVITRGASFVGAMPHLLDKFPNAAIRSFAVVRTVSTGDVDAILDPVAGVITYQQGRLSRNP